MTYFCAGLTGRYVTVRVPGIVAELSLCEVQVYSAGPLLSYKRPTKQSSQHWVYDSTRAVDGKRLWDLSQGSCMHTLQEETPWWRVTLDSTMKVQSVIVTNRGDAHGNRLTGAKVIVTDNPTMVRHGLAWGTQCGPDFSVATGATVEVVCNHGAIPGRYVYVMIPGMNKILSLCEVEVYGTDCDKDC